MLFRLGRIITAGRIVMIKRTDYLTDDARKIREEVFVREQGFQEEFGSKDYDSIHLVYYKEGEAIATCRYFPGEEEGLFWIGRFAVRKPYREKNIGKELLIRAEQEIQRDGGKRAQLSAQVRAKSFYEKCGYQVTGDVFYDEGCPHIDMKKDL